MKRPGASKAAMRAVRRIAYADGGAVEEDMPDPFSVAASRVARAAKPHGGRPEGAASEFLTSAVPDALRWADRVAERAYKTAEGRLRGEDYNPAPLVETAANLYGFNAPFVKGLGVVGGRLQRPRAEVAAELERAVGDINASTSPISATRQARQPAAAIEPPNVLNSLISRGERWADDMDDKTAATIIHDATRSDEYAANLLHGLLPPGRREPIWNAVTSLIEAGGPPRPTHRGVSFQDLEESLGRSVEDINAGVLERTPLQELEHRIKTKPDMESYIDDWERVGNRDFGDEALRNIGIEPTATPKPGNLVDRLSDDLLTSSNHDPEETAANLFKMAFNSPDKAEAIRRTLNSADHPNAGPEFMAEVENYLDKFIKSYGSDANPFNAAHFENVDRLLAMPAQAQSQVRQGVPRGVPQTEENVALSNTWHAYQAEMPMAHVEFGSTPVLKDKILPAFDGSLKKFADHFYGGLAEEGTLRIEGYGQRAIHIESRLRMPGTNQMSPAMERTITFGEDGGGVAKHHYFRLPKSEQSSGVAKKLIGNQVETYQRLGLSRVNTFANIDVGAYAWAKFGFLPTSPAGWRSYANYIGRKLQNVYNDAEGAMSQSSYQKMVATLKNDDPRAMWLFVDIKDESPFVGSNGKQLTWPQYFLTGEGVQGWDGTLDLKNPEVMRRFNNYVGKKN